MADLFVAGPLSLAAGTGILMRKRFGTLFGLLTCGFYLFGTGQVIILPAWQGPPYPIQLVIPPLFGIGITIGFMVWVFRHPNLP